MSDNDKLDSFLNSYDFMRLGQAMQQGSENMAMMIAFTSQLAHIVSNAYIKSPIAREHNGMSAGSYKDMTHVAWLSPEMWTELCMDNRDNLLKEMDILMDNLQKYKDALEHEDSEELKALFLEGKRLKEEVDS